MRGINKVLLLGNLGDAPESAATRDNTMVARFSVATGEEWTDGSGQKQSRTEWHNCTAFKRLAEVCITYLRKGSKVYIEGHIHTNQWQDEQGNKKSRKVIIVDELRMLDGKQEEGAPAQQGGYQPPAPAPAPAQEPAGYDPFDDDIPFD